MADTFLIHYDLNRNRHTWSTVNDAGELTSKITSGKLQQAAEQAGTLKVVVLLDNTVMQLAQAMLPAMNQQKLLRAIPFALEEQLADDVEDMHFVFSRKDRDGPVSIAAIARATLRGILDRFDEVGIKPAAVLPDCLCLAANEQQWCALIHDNQANFQYGSYVGNEFDADIFDTVLSAQLASTAQRPQKLILFTGEDQQIPDVATIVGDDIELVPVSYNTHPIVVYCGNYKNAMPLNLLQHEFKPVQTSGIAWRRWTLAATLAILWLAANLGVSGWELGQLRSHNEQLQAESVQIYRNSFPDSKRIVNPRVQMEQKLEELRSGGDGLSASMLALIAESASALAQDSSVELRSINFRNGRLDITIDSKNLNSIQRVNDRLNKTAGISSEIVSSSSDKGAVTGSLRIQQAAS